MRWGSRIGDKVDRLTTIIGEVEEIESARVPLDEAANRNNTLYDEIVTALEGLKNIAQELIDNQDVKSVAAARKIMVYRQSIKLLARTLPPKKTTR